MVTLAFSFDQSLCRPSIIQPLAYLLLTFFISTANSLGDEPVRFSVENSSNISESRIEQMTTTQLTVDEINHFVHLKQYYQGLISAKLSPIEWLGIFSETETDRKHYAQLLAERQIAIFDAISKFESEYLKALGTLANNGKFKKKSNQHLTLVTPFSCKDHTCQANINSSLDHLKRGGRLDVYLQGTTTNAELRVWAMLHQIPMRKIQSNQVTINHANTRLYQLQSGVYSLNDLGAPVKHW